jgi:uncharacterized membrane protein YfcA
VLQALAHTFSDLGPAQLLAIWAGLLFAAVLRSFTGFGFALAAVPVLSLFLVPVEAVVLTASLTILGNTLSLPSYRGDYAPRALLPLLALSLPGTALGVSFLKGLSAADFQLWIGPGVLLACLLLSVYRPAPRAPRAWQGAAVGFVSGLLNGAFAIPGPPVVIYAMATEHEPRRSRALLMYFFLFSAFIALGNFALAGYLSLRLLWLFLMAAPMMLLGDVLGTALFRRYGSRFYRRLALLTLYAVGAAITARALLAG